MADVIEIIIRATDLASAQIDRVADKIEQRFGRLERSYASLGSKTKDLEDDHFHLSRSLDKTADSIGDLDNAVKKYTASVDIAGDRTAAWTRHMEGINSPIKRASSELGDFDSILRRHGVTLGNTDVDRNRFQRAWLAIADGIMKAVSAATDWLSLNMGPNLAGLATHAKGLSVAFSAISTVFLIILGLAPLIVAAIAAITIAVEGLAGVIVALGAAIGVLVAALSTLVSIAGVLPLAMLGMLGIFAAIATVIGPAVTQIFGGVKALEEAEAKAKESAAATTKAQQEAQENLARIRRNASEREKDAETSLARLKRDNREEELNAERRIGDIRERVANAVAAAEARLAQLRRQNALLQTELEQDLNNARAELAGLETRGASPAEIAAARARVDERELALKLFNTGKEKQAEVEAANAVKKAKKDGQRELADAIKQLAVTIRNNNEQELDAEVRLTRLKRNNREEIAAAEKRVQEAAVTSALAANTAWTQLDETQQRIARRIKDIKDRFDELSEPTRNKFLAFMERFLDVVDKRLPGAVSVIDKFTTSLISMGDAWLKLSEDEIFSDNFNTNVDTANEGLLDVNHAFMGIADGINAVLAAGQPFYEWLGNQIAAFGDYVSESARVNQANGEIANFFDASKKVLEVFGRTLRDVFFALKNILEIGFNVGFDALFGEKGFGGMTKKFREFTESTKGRNAIREFFKDAIPVAKETFGLIGDILGAIAKLGREAIRGGEESPLFKALSFLREFFQSLPDRIRRFNQQWGPTVKNVIAAVIELGKAFNKLAEFMKPVLNVFAFIFYWIGKILQSKFVQWVLLIVGAIAAALVVALAFATGVGEIGVGIYALITAIAVLGVYWIKVWDQIISWIKHFFKWMGALFDKFDEWLTRFTEWWADMYLAVRQFTIDAFKALVGWLADIRNFFTSTIPSFASTAANAVANFFKAVFDKIGEQLDGVWKRITGWWDDIKNFFTNTIPGFAGRAAEAFGGLFKTIGNAAIAALNGLIGALETGIDLVFQAINEILEPARKVGGLINKLAPGPDINIPKFGEDTIELPRVPALAEGGIVPATPGGVYRVAEGGYPEAVLSLDPKYAARTMSLVQRVMSHLAGTAPMISAATKLSPASLNRRLPSFAAGGLVQAAAVGGNTNQFNIEINTTQVELDIPYIMRRLEVEVGGVLA